MDPANVREGYVDPGSAILRRADELLDCVVQRNPQARH
jgi:hypothetical protein